MRTGLSFSQVPVYVLTARALQEGEIPKGAGNERVFVEVINLEKLASEGGAAFARRRMLSLRWSSQLREGGRGYKLVLCSDVLAQQELLLASCASAVGRPPLEVLCQSA